MRRNGIITLAIILVVSLSLTSVTAFPKAVRPWEDREKWEKLFQEKMELLNETELEEKIEKRLKELEEKFNKTQERIKEKWRMTRKIYKTLRRNHSFYGSIEYDNGYAAGDFIKFTLNESTGEIFAYTLNRDGNATIFNFISFSEPSTENRVATHGSVLIYDGGNKIISAHDNPTGLLKIFARRNITVTLDVADGINISQKENNLLSLSGENIYGKIILSPSNNTKSQISLKNDTITATLQKNQRLLFLAEPVRDFTINASKWREYENKTIQGIARGHVGARIMVQLRNNLQNKNLSHIMTYANLKINCSVKPGKLVVKVSSNESGKTIVLDVDNATFNTTKLNQLKVILDNKSIEMASNYSDVLDPTDDGGEPEYLIVVGSNGLQVLVSIPKFSTHTIVVTEYPESSVSPSAGKTPGFTFTVMVITIIILFSILQRRKN